MLNILGNIAAVPLHPSPARWFRIAYAPGALARSLAVPLDSLTASTAVAGMLQFQRDHRPQHAELDELSCSWGPHDGRFEFRLERRMQRHGHAEATLSLVLGYALTPARAALAGTGAVSTSSPGYRAIARAAVIDRAIALRGGELLSS